MQSWLIMQSAVLDDIISLDGPGDAEVDLCGSCLSRESAPLYRCLECSYGLLFCRECIVKSHQNLPLHRLEVRFSFSPSHHTHTIRSVGSMDFSTEPLYIHLDSSVISDTEVPPVPSTLRLVISSSSTPTVGTKYKSNSVPAG